MFRSRTTYFFFPLILMLKCLPSMCSLKNVILYWLVLHSYICYRCNKVSHSGRSWLARKGNLLYQSLSGSSKYHVNFRNKIITLWLAFVYDIENHSHDYPYLSWGFSDPYYSHGYLYHAIYYFFDSVLVKEVGENQRL